MKYLIYILCICLFTFSCKKAKVRKGIEGLWKIESFELNYNAPYHYSGTYEFQSCSRNDNSVGLCKVIEKLILYESFIDTTYPEVTKVHNFKILKRGQELIFNGDKYSVELNGDNLILDEIIESREGRQTITLSRQ